MGLGGRSLIGFRKGVGEGQLFHGLSPETGQPLTPAFYSASPEDADLAMKLAAEAAPLYARESLIARAQFLDSIASRIEAIEDELVERAFQETALPEPRLHAEIHRTCQQLRFFAEIVREGSWTLPRIDRSDPKRKPSPKPDVRSVLRPIGPVAVFGASNFPFAFSVAGGDTASALAAGNPVIVKAHPAHPGTSELTGMAVRDSVLVSGFPGGVFSLLFDAGTEVGVRLVQDERIKAVGFTGSQKAGRFLFDLAMNRREPIPFYGEMSSTNPLFVLSGAMRSNHEKIAHDLYASFTLGAGQFCTKPGLIFVQESEATKQFLAYLRDKVNAAGPFSLLNPGIAASYECELRSREAEKQLLCSARGRSTKGSEGSQVSVALFETEAHKFLSEPSLADEHFGPSTLIVVYRTEDEVLECARRLTGQLTATIHGSEVDFRAHPELIQTLENRVGRIVMNGYPTGVEVCPAMIHGGPYPASTEARATSVGGLAIMRFARPVCYQDCPDWLLPAELQDANPHQVLRLIDGRYTRASVDGSSNR